MERKELTDESIEPLQSNDQSPQLDEQSNSTETVVDEPYKILIIDGMAMVNQINFTGLQTCKDFSNRFIKKLDFSTKDYHEVRLVFDRYVAKSLKSRTRDKRTAGVQIRYVDNYTNHSNTVKQRTFSKDIA